MRARYLTACAAILLLGSAAHAQDNRAESDRLFNEGLQLAGKKDFEHAREKFAAAYAKFPSPNSLMNLARSEQLSGHCIDAIKHFRSYVELPPNPRITDADRNEARGSIDACRQKVGRLLISAPAGTSVEIDDVPASLSEESAIEVMPGPHTVKLAGTQGVRVRELVAEADKDILVEYEPKQTQGGVGVATPHDDHSHDHGGGETEPHRTTAGWAVPATLAVLGLAGIGVGIGTGVASFSPASDANALRTPGVCGNPSASACVTYTDKVNSQNTLSTIATIGYAAGGALLVAGIVSFFVWPKSHVTEKVSIGPWVGPQNAGIFAVGRF